MGYGGRQESPEFAAGAGSVDGCLRATPASRLDSIGTSRDGTLAPTHKDRVTSQTISLM